MKRILTVLLASVLCISLFSGCDKENELEEIHSQVYEVAEVVFGDSTLDVVIVAGENSPIYSIDEDMLLYSKEYNEDDWRTRGNLETVELTKDNFDALFRSDDFEASSIRKDTVNAWQLIYNQDFFYYILQQKNGDLYLANGYYDYLEKEDVYSDDTSISWLFKLKKGDVSRFGGVNGPELTSSTVQIIEKKSDEDESSYQVGAYLPGTDFSSISQTLRNKITEEWKTYNGMTREQQLTSSKLWGPVSIQTDSWTECEETLGFALNNPLESTDWLEKTAYSGAEGEKHIIVTANSKNDTKKTVTDMYISVGYKAGDVQITLNANFCADSKTYTTGSTTNGYATFVEESLITGSDITVLVITADEENNNDYYNGDYYDPVAYWVRDNVFYSLRVFGDEANKEDIREVLEKILAEM